MNTISKYIIIIFITLGASNLFAQQTEDVVYLKNGSVIRGEVIEMIEGKIKIKTYNENIWVFDNSEIDKMAKEAKKTNSGTTKEIRKGYFNYTGLGMLAGSKKNNQFAPLSLLMVNGYNFNEHIGVGLGLGLEFFEQTLVPVFADFRYYLFKDATTPFIFLQSGYIFPQRSKSTENNYDSRLSSYYAYGEEVLKGGYLVNPGIGFKIAITKKTSFVISAAYRFQQINTAYQSWDQQVKRKYNYNRLAIRIGFIFN